jgi:hypothetical protein
LWPKRKIASACSMSLYVPGCPSALGQAMSEAVIRYWRELHSGCGFS